MTEAAIRSKLSRNGYSLVKMRDGYGVPGYYIADSYNYVIYGYPSCSWGLLDLDDIEDWIQEMLG